MRAVGTCLAPWQLRRELSNWIIFLLALVVLVAVSTPARVQAQAVLCPFEQDGGSLSKEGLILSRYARGVRGAALVANTGFAATDAPAIESTITCPSCGLDIDGDSVFTTVDAMIINRRLAGLSDNALTDGLNLGNGVRNTPETVKSFLLAGCSGGGTGTVTSITTGTGLSGGIITDAGTISIQPGYRLPQACANGQAPTWNGASWICNTLVLSCTNVSSAVETMSDGGGIVCAVATCPLGTVVTGGGQGAASYSANSALVNSAQYASYAFGNGWRVCHLGTSAMTGTLTFSATARCCSVQ